MPEHKESMLAFLFPGQGSQVLGMGGTLFDAYPNITQKANDILGYSIKELCLQDPQQQLNQTQYTQPALFTVNALTYFNKIDETHIKPDYLAGHSLGEYNALLAANVFDFETGLQLVKKRGELMQQIQNGAMAAILNLKASEIERLLKENALTNVTIANYNSHTQIVISGLNNEIEQAQLIFKKEKNVLCIPLKVSGAFHSPHMQHARMEFMEFTKDFKFSTPTAPVLSNVDARPYHPLITQTNLANQITHSVQWISIIEYLIAQKNCAFEEIGPGHVLKGLLHKIQKGQ